MTASLLEQLADLPKAEVDALIRALAPGETNAFQYDWRYRARPEQLPPAEPWRIWLLLAGRGIGKTRSGAEWVRAEVKAGRRRIALVGPMRAVLWLRAHPAFWPFRPIRSAALRAQQAPADLAQRGDRHHLFG